MPTRKRSTALPATSRPQPIEPGPGARIKELRTRAGLTQRQLAGDRYTAAYISALENGLTRSSMAALEYLAPRLGVTPDVFMRDEEPQWQRMYADLLLASEDWQAAVDAYTAILDTPVSDLDRALTLRGRAEAYCRLQRAAEALADASFAYPALVSAHRPIDAAYAGYWLAYAHYQLDNTDEARALIGQLLAEVRAGLSVQADFRLRLLVALANIEGVEGRHRQALAYLEEGRGVADELDDRRRATFLFSLALRYSETGDHEAALRTGTQALALYESAAAAYEIASLHNTLAITQMELGNLSRARSLALLALKEATAIGDDRLRSHVGDTQARIALAAGDAADAIGRATGARELARSIPYPRVEADALLTRARAHLAAKDANSAEADFASVVAVLRRNGPRSLLRVALREWSELLIDQDRHAEAVQLLLEATADYDELAAARADT
jgi:transcriptional regulator with XRE-family HTH domain